LTIGSSMWFTWIAKPGVGSMFITIGTAGKYS
jgi:hypothetical protein